MIRRQMGISENKMLALKCTFEPPHDKTNKMECVPSCLPEERLGP